MNDDDNEVRFGDGQPFSLGVEEELFTVDPLTGRQANSAGAVIERLGELSGSVAQELHELANGLSLFLGAGMQIHSFYNS